MLLRWSFEFADKLADCCSLTPSGWGVPFFLLLDELCRGHVPSVFRHDLEGFMLM